MDMAGHVHWTISQRLNVVSAGDGERGRPCPYAFSGTFQIDSKDTFPMHYLFRSPFPALGFSLALSGLSPVLAQQNPEDIPLDDEPVPTTPAPVAPAKPEPGPVVPVVPAPAATPAPLAAGDNITIPRAVWEQLLRDVEALKAERATASMAPIVAPATGEATASGAVAPAEAPANRNYLLLPDISFVGNSQALFSTDKRDEGRNSLDLEGEIGIQGYVYPGVKYDTYLVGNPAEEEFGIEEGYLTFLGAAKGLNVQIGRKFAPFGRTGELHPHSWLYSRQLIARQNLVAGEALVGNGINFNYLLPTGKNFFARLSLGAFSGGEEAGGRINTSDPSDPFEGGGPSRVGAGLSRFYNARLWMGKSFGEKNEVEFGLSHARGRAFIENFSGVDAGGSEIVDEAAGKLNLSSLDVSFRRFTGTNKRLLLRGELFKYRPRGLPTTNARGYYGLANYRLNKFNDIGLLYEKSDFANAPGLTEKATSLIYTRNFNERYYVRFTGTQGDRPGENNYKEGRVQFVIGLGPHTHELE